MKYVRRAVPSVRGAQTHSLAFAEDVNLPVIPALPTASALSLIAAFGKETTERGWSKRDEEVTTTNSIEIRQRSTSTTSEFLKIPSR